MINPLLLKGGSQGKGSGRNVLVCRRIEQDGVCVDPQCRWCLSNALGNGLMERQGNQTGASVPANSAALSLMATSGAMSLTSMGQRQNGEIKTAIDAQLGSDPVSGSVSIGTDSATAFSGAVVQGTPSTISSSMTQMGVANPVHIGVADTLCSSMHDGVQVPYMYKSPVLPPAYTWVAVPMLKDAVRFLQRRCDLELKLPLSPLLADCRLQDVLDQIANSCVHLPADDVRLPQLRTVLLDLVTKLRASGMIPPTAAGWNSLGGDGVAHGFAVPQTPKANPSAKFPSVAPNPNLAAGLGPLHLPKQPAVPKNGAAVGQPAAGHPAAAQGGMHAAPAPALPPQGLFQDQAPLQATQAGMGMDMTQALGLMNTQMQSNMDNLLTQVTAMVAEVRPRKVHVSAAVEAAGSSGSAISPSAVNEFAQMLNGAERAAIGQDTGGLSVPLPPLENDASL